jgi:hypothetical protein
VAVGFFLSGISCAGVGNYLQFKAARSTEYPMNIQTLQENWQEYSIAYAGLSRKSPSAILFQSKESEKRLTYDKWVPVSSPEHMDEVIHWLNNNPNFPPVLWALVGPEGNLYGYIYSYYQSVYMKQIDPDTWFIGDLPLPPFDYGPGPGINVGGP